MKNILQYDLDYSYGSVAKDIYLQCCKKFGWREGIAYVYGKKQLLFAPYATREGYGVWFLAHNNWTKTNNGFWQNEIFLEKQEIVESWPSRTSNYYDTSIRIVFAKKDDKYIFLGMYKLLSQEESFWKTDFCSNDGRIIACKGDKKYVKTYVKISDTYPAPGLIMDLENHSVSNLADLVPMPRGHLWRRKEYALVFEKFLQTFVFRKQNLTYTQFIWKILGMCEFEYLQIENVAPVIRRIKWIVDEWKIPNTASFDGEINSSEKLLMVTDGIIKKYSLDIFKNQ